MPATLIRQVRIYVFQSAVHPPIRASFGQIKERCLLLLAVDDDEGHTGWGEVWSALPAFGARHRAELLEKLIAPQLVGKVLGDPAEHYQSLAKSLLPVVRL